MLSVQDVTISIGGKTICRDLNVDIQIGERWGVLGQNGAGKSTLLRVLAGLAIPQAGRVCWDGRPLLKDSIGKLGAGRRDLARKLTLLPQHEQGEFWGSVTDYVLLGRFPHRATWAGYGAEDERIALQAIEQMGLSLLRDRALGTLSGGERQRAALAQLLAQQTSCLLLDEPLQHLDLRYQAAVMRQFTQVDVQDRAVMMVLHDPLWVQRCCDHVLMLFPDGSVMHGPVAGLLTRERLESLYECPLTELIAGAERAFAPSV